MTLKAEPLLINGMNNRELDTALPKGEARNAVNVLFDNEGNIIFPRQGKTLVYAGNCHSVYKGKTTTLFVEDGVLKSLNADYTSTPLLSGWGTGKTDYTEIGDTIYCSNVFGKTAKVRDSIASEWGTPRPTRQPDCTPVSVGGLFAGDYRVALTWLADEESGTGMGRRITVVEGGGIRVNNLPEPPDFVTGYALYVSSVNSQDMYLYGEFSLDQDEVHIGRFTPAGVLPTEPLETQFCYPPKPIGAPTTEHHGRIYYARGNKLYYTEPQSYGLQKAYSYLPFERDVLTINSTPNVLYVGTETLFGKVTNLDSSDGSPPVFEPLQPCGTVRGTEVDDPNGLVSYVMSQRGLLELSPTGVIEKSFGSVAIPHFKIGSTTILEYNGLSYLVGSFQEGTQNPLANPQVNISELARGSL